MLCRRRLVQDVCVAPTIQCNKTSYYSLSNMASLVADYGSDSATSEEDEDPGPEEQLQGEVRVDSRNNPERNYFLPVDSEEEDDENSGDVVDAKDASSDPQQQNAVKLPKPSFGKDEGVSVFANPYRAAEEARNSLLEKHVKMTPTGNSQQRSILGKKVCWNYRKGRCRFGSTCKFAHDSDIAVSKQAAAAVDNSAAAEAAGGANNFTN